MGLWNTSPYVRLVLKQQRRHQRMAWLTAHSPGNYTLQQWRRVLFTDESRYLLYRSDRRQRVYRRCRERYTGQCVVKRDRYSGGGVMLWVGICHGRKTPLIFIEGNPTAVRYRDVLTPVVLPFVRRHNVVYQHARICSDYLVANNVNVLPCQRTAQIYRQLSVFGTFWTAKLGRAIPLHRHYKDWGKL